MNALKTSLLGIALATALPAGAQEMDHSKMAMPMSPSTETKPTAKKQPVAEPAPKIAAKPAVADPHAGHPMAPATAAKPAAMPMDHSKMDHAMPEPPAEIAPPMDHAGMGHDMAGMSMEAMPGMQHGDMEMAPGEPRTPIPPIMPSTAIRYSIAWKAGMPIRARGRLGKDKAGSAQTWTACGGAAKASGSMGVPSRPIWKCFTGAAFRPGGTWSPACATTSSPAIRRTSSRSACRAWRHTSSKSRPRPTSANPGKPVRAWKLSTKRC
jgi:hypothetical protein